MTETQDELSLLTSEVFRRVGRNVFNFQKVELMLKFLVTNGALSGPAKELKAKRQALADSLHKMTMGQMAGRFVEDILSDAGDSKDLPEIVTEPWISFKMRFVPSDPLSTEIIDRLKAVVEERNDLVHHMLSRWNDSSLESTKSVLKELDEQRERLIPLYTQLASMVRDLKQGQKAAVDFLSSDEGRKAIELSWLLQSPTVGLLRDCAQQLSRADGWLPLTTAVQVIRQQELEDARHLKERYGHSTLKQFMIASQLFDIQDEPTERGVRTVYRLKPEAASVIN